MSFFSQIFIFIFFSTFVFSAHSLTVPNSISKDVAEQEIISIVELIHEQKTNEALQKLKQLRVQQPDFQLAKVIQSDLLLSNSKTLDNAFSSEPNTSKRNGLLSELKVRFNNNNLVSEYQDKIPEVIHYISPSIPYFLAFDYSQSRLFLFKNSTNNISLISSQYLTIGKKGSLKQRMGDNRSPIGVYRITSFLDDRQIPELYGWGAFPINYPNEWDKKLKRTGSGIWLHGTPRNNYSRAPLASRGCLVVSNNFLQELSSFIGINTPMILSNKLNWINSKKKVNSSSEWLKRINNWKDSWRLKNMATYSKFYSKKFNSRSKNFSQWMKHKNKFFTGNYPINISIDNISIVEYPGENNLVSVTFLQDYQHRNYHSKSIKQQFWKKDQDNNWQIIIEK